MPRIKKTETIKKVTKAPKRTTGLTVDVYNIKGKVVRNIALPKEIFGAKVNKQLLAQAVRVYLANQRGGTATTKTRGEVIGSTRKIYRQKGTGRARHGAITAPIFVGGGVVFGPRKRDYSLTLSKKMKKQALFSALTAKKGEGAVTIVASLDKILPKTKEMVAVLDKFSFANNKRLLLVLAESGKTDNIRKAARNIEGVTIESSLSINPYVVLKSGNVVFMEEAIEGLKSHFIGGNKNV